MKLAFTSTARCDLHEIGDDIARDSRRQAQRFVRTLEAFCTSLLEQPQRYPLLLRREDRGIRRAPHRDYLVFYRVEDRMVEIPRVLHAARDVESLFDRP